MELEPTATSVQIHAPLANDQIRLLRLHPAVSRDVPLSGTLETRSLLEKPEYEALSYAWDGAFDDQEIPDGVLLVRGQERTIKGNLSHALQRLRHSEVRHSERDRILWIDAVCINQEDLIERKAQVGMMADIYSSARGVIAWLGEDSAKGDGQVIFDQCMELTRISHSRWSRGWRHAILGILEVVPGGSSHLGPLVHKVLYPVVALTTHEGKSGDTTFFERRYFKRRWCIQEIVLAKELTMACGSWTLPWSTVANCWEDLAAHWTNRCLRPGRPPPKKRHPYHTICSPMVLDVPMPGS